MSARRRIVFDALLEPVAKPSERFAVRIRATEVLLLEGNGSVADSQITEFELVGFAPNGDYRLLYSYRGQQHSLPCRSQYGVLVYRPGV